MKIIVLSDLHLELSSFTPARVDADIIVLPGDIHKNNHGIYWAREVWPDKPIIYVAGNHEFYHFDRLSVIENLRDAAKEQDVYFLENDEVIIDGVRFLGCTLWTDFELFGLARKKECLSLAKDRLSDFSVIVENGLKFTPEDSLRLHNQSRDWLSRKLIDESFDGNTVVITHHCPSWQSVALKYQHDLLSACFSSRLDDLIGHSSLWIHGHTHESFDYTINDSKVVCNPRGYVLRNSVENPSFDNSKIVNLS